jgi:cytoskeletal protein RodZ
MPSLGEELKRQRELRDISLREISNSTKISVRILEAIENNNYKILPGGVFNRNFIRAYAEFIGLDPENTVRKYQQQSDPDGNHSDTGSRDLDLALIATPRPRTHQVFFYVATVVVLVAAALVYFLWYHHA